MEKEKFYNALAGLKRRGENGDEKMGFRISYQDTYGTTGGWSIEFPKSTILEYVSNVNQITDLMESWGWDVCVTEK